MVLLKCIFYKHCNIRLNSITYSVSNTGIYVIYIIKLGYISFVVNANVNSTAIGVCKCNNFFVKLIYIIDLETPEINALGEKGKQINFAVGSPREDARFEMLFDDFLQTYQAEFDEDTLDGKSIYLIADSYLNPDKPVVYSDTDKVEFPNLEDKEIADKYTWEYASALFE